MKKWIILLSGVCLQTVLGGVYGWSAFVPSLNKDYGLTKGQTGLIFGVTIAVFTITMIPAGRLLKKYGPRIIATTGAALFTAGYVLASMSNGDYLLILIGIGVLTGAGIGAGYVCPLTVGMKWFPNNKGLVTGVAVAGFGGGAIILSYLVRYLLISYNYNVLQIFNLIGISLGSIAIIAGLFLSEPEKIINKSSGDTKEAIPVKQYVFSRAFALLFAGMFAGTFAGLLIVGNLKLILLDSGLDGKTATLGISCFAIGNAVGRIVWGQIHDRLGARYTILLSLACLGIATLLLASQLSPVFLLAVVAIIGAGFGACFVVYASSIVKYYGIDAFPVLYPICFLGYGLAGIIGPAIGGRIADTTGSFAVAIILSVSVVFVAFVLNAAGLFLVQDKNQKNYLKAC